MFELFLADTSADCVLSYVVIVRSDGGGELCWGNSAACVDRDVSVRNLPLPTVPNSKG